MTENRPEFDAFLAFSDAAVEQTAGKSAEASLTSLQAGPVNPLAAADHGFPDGGAVSQEQAKLDLGPYVIARPRTDGTFRVCQEVPKRIRPHEWPASIPLPIAGRTGDLNDPEERARIQKDAEALYARMISQKNEHTPVEALHTWGTLQALWENTTKFKELRERSRKDYLRDARYLQKYFDQHPGLDPSKIKESEVELLLENWSHSRDRKYEIRNVLNQLLEKAVKEKWRNDNPVAGIKVRRPKVEERRVTIWEENDVKRMSAACIAAGQPGIAALILMNWEIGQRLTDARSFQHGVQYFDDGAFRFNQQKTGNPVEIFAPDHLRPFIEHGKIDGGFLFVNEKTGRPFEEQELVTAFANIRNCLPEYHERRIKLRNLRHSCVVQLARAGCEVPEIAAVTGHSLQSVYLILQHYLPRDSTVARNAMEKRQKMKLANGES